MRKLNSNVANLVGRATKLLNGQTDQINCAAAQELMSPFIDSMATSKKSRNLNFT